MAGLDAFGTQFKIGDGQESPTFTIVAHVTNIPGLNRTKAAYESTTHQSPDKYREYVPGLKDGGTFSPTLRYDPTDASHALLETFFESDDLVTCQIVVLPDTADEDTWEFDAVCTGLGDEFPHDGLMGRTVDIQVSGKPVLTATGA